MEQGDPGMTRALLPPLLALSGFGLGLLYFLAIRRTAGLIAGRGGWAAPALLTLGRLASALLIFGAIARCGAAPLLAAFLGFLAARAVTRRRWGTAP
jgi:hypothetical protein